MNTKHTPGPWIATGWENTVVNIPDIYFGGHLTICVYPASGQAPRSEAVANARLIAAAPDLLEALEAIRARIAGEFDNPALVKFGGLRDINEDVNTLAATTIAKATEKVA